MPVLLRLVKEHKPAAAVLLVSAILLAAVYWKTRVHPRTDDASVRANYILLAPEVTGRILDLRVHDNQQVHSGDTLFVIDQRPYQYALEQALSNQELLEQQIIDMQRRIAAQGAAVTAARAGLAGSRSEHLGVASSVQAATASVQRARAYLDSTRAQQKLADDDLRRIEPLLARQFVTVQQVDDVRTRAQVAAHNEQQAAAALDEALAQQARAQAQQQAASDSVTASLARVSQSESTIERLETLEAQRTARAALVSQARLDLDRCTVRAPFDGYVTNLNISEGEVAKAGAPVFTLLDRRTWWVVANYRESDLRFIAPGKHVDVYLLGVPSHRFDGVVESIGNGVAPDDDNIANGLPQIDHTLNWVHLAARFPVRIRVQNPDPRLFRMGETAISIVR